MREKLAEWLREFGGRTRGKRWYAADENSREYFRRHADALIAFMRENGWVKLADDQVPPSVDNPYPQGSHAHSAYAIGAYDTQRGMRLAGFRKVE